MNEGALGRTAKSNCIFDKFERRFRALEATFAERGEALEEATLEEMDRVWDQVKRVEQEQ